MHDSQSCHQAIHNAFGPTPVASSLLALDLLKAGHK